MLNIPIRVSAMIFLVFTALMISPTFISKSYSQQASISVPKNNIIKESASKPEIKAQISASSDDRAIRLRSYLQFHRSPMTNHASSFIDIADKYDLDWKLLPAIAGVESTYGLAVPYNSFNAYGWHNGAYRFGSWSAATDHVAGSIVQKWGYLGEITPWKIGRFYAANPHWAASVNRNMLAISTFK